MTFSYTRLHSPDSIRILTLEPGYGNTPLNAHLTVHGLDHHASYDALSYVWGDSDPIETLIVDHQVFAMPKNLHTILLHLRLPDSPRNIWIDAVCINQQDGIEKGQQVAIMGQIYKRAVTVLCWLGHLTTHRLWALKFIQTLSEDAHKYLKPDVAEYYWTIPLNDDVLLPNVDADQVVESALAAHVEALYSHEWFTRLWIVQELALATNPKIICSHLELDWQAFEIATRILVRCALNSSRSSIPLHVLNSPWDLVSLRGKYKLNSRSAADGPVVIHVDQQWSIGRLAWDMRHKECKDDRDKVYALLSLTTDGISPQVLKPDAFAPDYTKPVPWVYHQFWRRFGGCTSLFYAGLSRRRNHVKSKESEFVVENVSRYFCNSYLPSWVPDLRLRPLDEWNPIFGLDYGTSTPFHHMAGHITQGPSGLMIRGHRFDVVARLFPCQVTDNFWKLRATMQSFLSLEHEYAPYPTGQTWIEALGSTLMMDSPYDHEHPFQEYVNALEPQIKLSDSQLQRIWALYQSLLLSNTGKVWRKICSLVKFQKVSQFNTTEKLNHEGQLVCMLHKYLGKVLQTHCLIVTQKGYMGLAPPDTRVGDIVAALGGPTVPFVIRDTSSVAFGELEANESHGSAVSSDIGNIVSQLLGPCYLQGIMKAELFMDDKWMTELEWEKDKLGMIPKPTIYLI